MSVRETIVLSRTDLKYLLIDSLRLYSSNVVFMDGNNPYRFSINKKTFFVLIKNVHESGDGRSNPDECRIQVSRSRGFDPALSINRNVMVLGYFPDKKIFTAWNPYLMQERFNTKQTISLYSRFSVQEAANMLGISNYQDSNAQKIISFRPEYLGLYLDNIERIHNLQEADLLALVKKSDELNEKLEDGKFDVDGEYLSITHNKIVRDPKFRKIIYEAYGYKCAMCGMQLELVEAAHIVPHSHEQGTDEVGNGICLCVLHHSAYDQSLVYFNIDFEIKINTKKIEFLEKIGLDSGYRKLNDLGFDKIILPKNHSQHPNSSNINLANQIRGIDGY